MCLSGGYQSERLGDSSVLGGFLDGADSFDDARSGGSLDVRKAADLRHEVSAHDILFPPVPSLYEHIGSYESYEIVRSVFAEDRHVVYLFEGGKDFGSLGLGNDGPSGLESRDGAV